MTEYVAETYEEVREKLQAASWEIMDEEQRDEVMEKVVEPRWGKTTHDGIVLKGTAWAKLLGTTEATIRNRHARLQARDQGEPASASAPAPNQRASIRSARAAIKAHPELAADLLGDPDVAEAIDDASITLRVAANAVHGPAPDPRQVGERVRRNMGKALGDETDAATDYLNGAASDLGNAIMCRDEWGIQWPESHDVALARVERMLARYKAEGETGLSGEDQAWLESIGVSR
jgi:hypothetical protein